MLKFQDLKVKWKFNTKSHNQCKPGKCYSKMNEDERWRKVSTSRNSNENYSSLECNYDENQGGEKRIVWKHTHMHGVDLTK